MRNFVLLLALGSLVALPACTTTTDKEESTHLAAYAASARYPGDLKADASSNVGVMVEPASKVLRIVNFSDNAINDAEVWVNHSFVAKVDTIPPMGSVRVNESLFYDHDGHSLTQNQVAITNVQLHAGNHIWNLLGPIVQ